MIKPSVVFPVLRSQAPFYWDGSEIPGTPDNRSGVGDNSRVTFTADETFPVYFIAVGAFGNHEGTYTLSVTDVTE